MTANDFKEIAEFCINRYKEEHNSLYSDIYKGTLYVVISSDDKVYCSNTTHILSDASKLILIHKRLEKSGIRWYDNYKLEFIDQDKTVKDGYIGNGLRLYIDSSTMRLVREMNNHSSEFVKDWSAPFENKMQEIWDICCKFRAVNSEEEAELLIDVINDEKTHYKLKAELASAYKLLEELNEKYKELLDKINNLIG